MEKIVFVAERYDACSWYRAHVPGVELRKLGYDVSLVLARDWALTDQSDALVFERTSGREALEDLKRYKEAGKRVVYDIDDNVWNLNPANPAFPYFERESIRRNIAESLRLADVVTVTTPELAEIVAKYNRSILVIPNYLPDEHWNLKRDISAKLTIGWAGGNSHWNDLKLIAGVVEQILEDFSDIEIALAGMREYPFADHPRIRKLKTVKLEEYPALLANFDIALAPLTDDSFNACKSDLKFLEYAALGLPVVASKVPAYEHSIVHGENGFLARNQKDWLKYLRRLIADEGLRESIGRAARSFAESRFISKNIGLWIEALGLSASNRSTRHR